MSVTNGIYSVGEIADHFKVSQSPVRSIIDRLGLGTRVNYIRVVFTEDLPAIELALRAMGKLKAPVQLEWNVEVPDDATIDATVDGVSGGEVGTINSAILDHRIDAQQAEQWLRDSGREATRPET